MVYFLETKEVPRLEPIILNSLPHMGDVVVRFERYSCCRRMKQMQQAYKSQTTHRPTAPERHFELRIGEGLFVFCLFTVLMLVLF